MRINDVDFGPHRVVIPASGTVTWRFQDAPTPHNFTSRGHDRFRSSPTKPKGTYTVRFRHLGTYRYVCTIHFNMKGTVTVR